MLKEIEVAGEKFKLIVRFLTGQDSSNYKNSIITFMKIDSKEWNRLLRNKKILYRKE
mgnify:FL=1